MVNSTATKMSTTSFKMLSLNVKGLGNRSKRASIFRWLKKCKSDIIFIQEAHCSPEIENQWKREWGSTIIYSHGKVIVEVVLYYLTVNLTF